MPVDEVADLITQALDADQATIAIPGTSPFRMSVAQDGSSLGVVVWHPHNDEEAPVAMIAIAANGRPATRLWNSHVGVADELGITYPANIEKPPAPWCATLLLPYCADLRPSWLADFEHVLAWAWVLMRQDSDRSSR